MIKLSDTECKIADRFQLTIPWNDPDVIMHAKLNVGLHRLQSLRASLRKKSMLHDYDQQLNFFGFVMTNYAFPFNISRVWRCMVRM